jgi:hypothetical protein
MFRSRRKMNPIRAYIERAPEAISGKGGHLTTLYVARSLFNGFALSRDQVLEGLHVYNARLSDKWSDSELTHKADSAVCAIYDKPRGWMLNRHQSWEPRRISIHAQKITHHDQKIAKKYVPATDATDIFHMSCNAYADIRTERMESQK